MLWLHYKSIDGRVKSRDFCFRGAVQWPFGLAIDFPSSKLYWADHLEKEIQSCGHDIRNVVTIAEVLDEPWWNAVVNQTVHWSFMEAKRVDSMVVIMDHGIVRNVYEGTGVSVDLLSVDLPGRDTPRK